MIQDNHFKKKTIRYSHGVSSSKVFDAPYKIVTKKLILGFFTSTDSTTKIILTKIHKFKKLIFFFKSVEVNSC